jgi:type IV pilus assembly protein PilC
MKFIWKGLKSNAFVSGTLEAPSKEEAIFSLKKEGVIVTEINANSLEVKDFKEKKSFFTSKVNDAELLLFTRKLSTMISAGLALVPALTMLRNQSENSALTGVINDLINQVNEGIPLSKSLEKYPDLFDIVYINLVNAGEASGGLDTFLKRISVNLEKKIKIIRALKSAMMYPTILLSVATIVVGVMMIFVVPTFVEIFANAGVALPGPTKLVMSISNFFRSRYLPISAAIIYMGFFFFKKSLKNNLALRKKIDKQTLKLPVMGKLIENSIMARFSMVLSNLISGGVNLVESMEIAKNSIPNEHIRESLDKVKRDIFSGRPFANSLRETKSFPETLCGFVEVGEETGKLNDMLNTISLFYEEEFDVSVENFSQLLEPIMIVFLGVVIGFILVAMYMPIFKMGGAVAGA